MALLRSANASIFSHILQDMHLKLPIITCTKSTLTHLSHLLEDIVIDHQLPALVYSGFQESTYWKHETQRYERMAEVAEGVCVFAGQSVSVENDQFRELYVQIHPDDPLMQEWFVIINSPAFSVLLCGRDNHNPAYSENQREFDTIWTFDTDIVDEVIELLETVVEGYVPNRLEPLRAARLNIQHRSADPHLLAGIIIDLIQFEESLNQRLRLKNHLLDTILSTIDHHVYATEVQNDGRHRLLFESPNITHLCGLLEREPDLTLKIWTEDYVLPEDQEIVHEHLVRLHQGVASAADYRIYQQSGAVIWIHDVANVEQDPSTGLLRFYGVMQDISERKLIEQQGRERERLQIALEHERQYSDLKTRFMVNVSHQFRTPLATMRTGLDILTRYGDKLSEAQKQERLQALMQQLAAITEVVDSVTVMLNDQVVTRMLRPEKVDLYDLYLQIVDSFRVNLPAGKHFDAQYSGEKLAACVDVSIVRTVAENLLSNGLKFTDEGGHIVLRFAVAPDALVVSVQDDGIGIPAPDLRNLFDAFFRAENAENHPGIGLGLRMAHDRVILHGGTMDIRSEVNAGTLVIARLPFLNPEV